MHPLRTGQSQVLTAVLLGGIILAAITSAFLWGMPLLEKNQDANAVRGTVEDFKTLSSGIEDVIKEGGSRTVTLRMGKGALRIDTDDDMITYQSSTKGAYVSTENWVPLNENDLNGVPDTSFSSGYGIRGVDQFGVLVGKTTIAGEDFLTRYRLAYRPLKDPNTQQTYQIDLVPLGKDSVSGGGQRTITFQRGETTVEPGNGIDGGTLHRIQLLVQVT